ncbi:unnamed protein product [Camellia sinensis]
MTFSDWEVNNLRSPDAIVPGFEGLLVIWCGVGLAFEEPFRLLGIFHRYCMVLFAGIVAEPLVYGEARGGENDITCSRVSVFVWNPHYLLHSVGG